MGKRLTLSPASAPTRPGATLAYEAGIGLVGWGILIASTMATQQRLEVAPALFFLILAIGLKVEGFRVAHLVTHSLAGVAVLAALLVMGPSGGAWVATLGGLIFMAIRLRPAPSQANPSPDHHPDHEASPSSFSGGRRLRLALFSGGLNALVLLAAGQVYGLLGGRWAPTTLQWHDLPPLLALCLTWFLGDHLGWSLRIALAEGSAGLERFLRAIQVYSLAVELLPLPLAAVLAIAYRILDPLALGLLGLFLLAVGELLRRLNMTLNHARERVADLTTLNAFSRALLASKLDVQALCQLLQAHTTAVLGPQRFWLGLFDARRQHIEPAIATGGASTPHPQLIEWVKKGPAPLLVRDAERDSLPFAPSAGDHRFRAALWVPLQAAEEMIGLLTVESGRPNAFSSDDLRTVATFANQTAMAIQNARSYQAAQRRARQVATVGEVSRQVVAILGMDQLFSRVVTLIREAFGYYHVQIFTIDPASQEIRFQASTSPLLNEQGVRVAPGQGLIGWVGQTGEAIVINEVHGEPRYRLIEGLEATRSEAVVPLKVDERLVGILDVQSDRPDTFGSEDIYVLQTLADQVAIAIEDNRIYAAQQEQTWVSTALLQVAESLANLTGLDEVLDAANRLVPLLVGADRSFIFLRDEDTGELCVLRAHGLGNPSREHLLGRPLREVAPSLTEALEAGSAPLDLTAETEAGREAQAALGLAAGVAIPLRAGGETIGALATGYREPQPLSGGRRAVLGGIANQAAMAIQNAHLYIAQREEAWVSTALLQVAELAGRTKDLDEILAGVVRLTAMLTGVDRSCIFLWDGERRRYVPSHAYGLSEPLRKRMAGLSLSVGDFPLLDRVREAGAPLAAEGADLYELVPPALAEAFSIRSALGLPLRSQDEVQGIMVVDYVGQPHHFSQRRIALLSGLTNQAGIAIENVRLYRESLERERMAQELRVARRIQATFLPESCPQIPGWSIAALSQPAREVSGDFYDFFPLAAQRLGLVIADVSDKGVPAALFMALSRNVMRAIALEGRSPADTLGRVNDLLRADSRSGMFVTLFYGILDTQTGELALASAGHNPAYLRRRDGRLERLVCRGIALGVIERPAFQELQVRLEPGDALALYTDGVTESFDPEEREFGEEGLQAALRSATAGDANGLMDAIGRAVRRFVRGAPQADDLTMVVVVRR